MSQTYLMSHPSPGPNSRRPKLNQDLEDVKKKKKKKTESSAMETTIHKIKKYTEYWIRLMRDYTP